MRRAVRLVSWERNPYPSRSEGQKSTGDECPMGCGAAWWALSAEGGGRGPVAREAPGGVPGGAPSSPRQKDGQGICVALVGDPGTLPGQGVPLAQRCGPFGDHLAGPVPAAGLNFVPSGTPILAEPASGSDPFREPSPPLLTLFLRLSSPLRPPALHLGVILNARGAGGILPSNIPRLEKGDALASLPACASPAQPESAARRRGWKGGRQLVPGM